MSDKFMKHQKKTPSKRHLFLLYCSPSYSWIEIEKKKKVHKAKAVDEEGFNAGETHNKQ